MQFPMRDEVVQWNHARTLLERRDPQAHRFDSWPRSDLIPFSTLTARDKHLALEGATDDEPKFGKVWEVMGMALTFASIAGWGSTIPAVPATTKGEGSRHLPKR
ncbi:hypothetical protein E2C01_023480 [Portunus trituberculatus]|uniref:Uncharacterized protein n=1 Tax=Portunus trituberculatus TaxID=210409 RepID=A0A5B7E833_PORTR|nr:hypothetical protein [Portunus trituberculatus]